MPGIKKNAEPNKHPPNPAPKGSYFPPMLHPVSGIVVADYVFFGMIVPANNRQFPHVEAGMLQFLDGHFGFGVRLVDRHNRILCSYWS